MILACNYYPETEGLVREGLIDIDYFKFPALGYQINMGDPDLKTNLEEFLLRVSAIKPVLLHGLFPDPLNLASANMIDTFNPSLYTRQIEVSKTPVLSFHPTLAATGPETDYDKVANNIVRNLRFLAVFYSGMEPIEVENLDGLRFGKLIDPQYISDIVIRAECSFLLDISHAVCASRHLKKDIRDYLRLLPLEKVTEIHINGWIFRGADIMCHTKINEDGYQLLRELLDVCNPKIITIEYGRDNDRIGAGIPLISPDKSNELVKLEIIEQVQRIRALVKNRS
jgi:uncharacterized protein